MKGVTYDLATSQGGDCLYVNTTKEFTYGAHFAYGVANPGYTRSISIEHAFKCCSQTGLFHGSVSVVRHLNAVNLCTANAADSCGLFSSNTHMVGAPHAVAVSKQMTEIAQIYNLSAIVASITLAPTPSR